MSFSFLAFLAITTSADAQTVRDHSHLIPQFSCTWIPGCTDYLHIGAATMTSTPNQSLPQMNIGMTGLFDPTEVLDSGIVITNALADANNHFAEHWFIVGPFNWTADLDAVFQGAPGPLPVDYKADPYLYMDIRYKQVPTPDKTDGLDLIDPMIERMNFDVLQENSAGGLEVTATLMRELWHLPGGDAYMDYWLFKDVGLLLNVAGDEMSIVPSPVQELHPADWFDTNRPQSAMYTRIEYKEWTGAAY